MDGIGGTSINNQFLSYDRRDVEMGHYRRTCLNSRLLMMVKSFMWGHGISSRVHIYEDHEIMKIVNTNIVLPIYRYKIP
ncbi:hypothetical protein BDE02_12G012800 [Populus trichocarpa]|nr:hypothetical protein BDE02_12G012800 [Populus trichocarpa]